MKPIKYDRHAKRRMKEREVAEEEVESIMKNPDSLGKSGKERMNAFKFMNGRYLRVSFKEEMDYTIVVTVTVRKKPYGEPHEDRIQ